MVFTLLTIILICCYTVGASDVRVIPQKDKIILREGERFPFIRCSSGCIRSCVYSWIRVQPYDEVIQEGRRMLKGTLAKVGYNGKYVCQVKEKWRQTRRSEEFEIVVIEAKIPIVSVGNQQNLTMLQGQTFVLRVYIQFRTRTTNITLLKDGKEIQTLQLISDIYDFDMGEVDCNSTGWYRVKANNHIGQSLSEIVTLNVLCDSSLTKNYTPENDYDSPTVRRGQSTAAIILEERLTKESNVNTTTETAASLTSVNELVDGIVMNKSKNNDALNETSYLQTLNLRSTTHSRKDFVDHKLTSGLILKGENLNKSNNTKVINHTSSSLITNGIILIKHKDVAMTKHPVSAFTTDDSGQQKLTNENVAPLYTNEGFKQSETDITAYGPTVPVTVVTVNESFTTYSTIGRGVPFNAIRQQSKSVDSEGGWTYFALVATFVAGVVVGVLAFVATKRLRGRLHAVDITPMHAVNLTDMADRDIIRSGRNTRNGDKEDSAESESNKPLNTARITEMCPQMKSNTESGSNKPLNTARITEMCPQMKSNTESGSNKPLNTARITEMCPHVKSNTESGSNKSLNTSRITEMCPQMKSNTESGSNKSLNTARVTEMCRQVIINNESESNKPLDTARATEMCPQGISNTKSESNKPLNTMREAEVCNTESESNISLRVSEKCSQISSNKVESIFRETSV